jgi:hypothetical protein
MLLIPSGGAGLFSELFFGKRNACVWPFAGCSGFITMAFVNRGVETVKHLHWWADICMHTHTQSLSHHHYRLINIEC